MSSSSLSLDPNVRANLRALNLIETLMEKTEKRNNSGHKINSAIDGPSAYFMSKSLSNRANMLNNLMDSITLAVNTVDSAGSAVASLQNLLDLSKSYANDALDVSNETLTIISNKSFSSTDILTEQVGVFEGDEIEITLSGQESKSISVKISATDTINKLANKINTANTEAGDYNITAKVTDGKLIISQKDGLEFQIKDKVGSASMALGLPATKASTSLVLSGSLGFNDNSSIDITVGGTTKTITVGKSTTRDDFIELITDAFPALSVTVNGSDEIVITSAVPMDIVESGSDYTLGESQITTFTDYARVEVTVGAASFEVAFNSSDDTNAEIINKLQTAANSALGAGVVTFSVTSNGNLQAQTDTGVSVSIADVELARTTGNVDLTGIDYAALIGGQMTVQIGAGAVKTIEIEAADGIDTPAELRDFVINSLEDGGDYTEGVDFIVELTADNYLQITSLNESEAIEIDGGTLDTLATSLGLQAASTAYTGTGTAHLSGASFAKDTRLSSNVLSVLGIPAQSGVLSVTTDEQTSGILDFNNGSKIEVTVGSKTKILSFDETTTRADFIEELSSEFPELTINVINNQIFIDAGENNLKIIEAGKVVRKGNEAVTAFTDDSRVEVTVGGVGFFVDFTDGDSPADIINKLQAETDNVIGTSEVSYALDGTGKLEVTTKAGVSFSIKSVAWERATGAADLTALNYAADVVGKAMKIQIGSGITKNITIDASIDMPQKLMDTIAEQLSTDAYTQGIHFNIKITADNHLQITSLDGDVITIDEGTAGDLAKTLGLSTTSVSYTGEGANHLIGEEISVDRDLSSNIISTLGLAGDFSSTNSNNLRKSYSEQFNAMLIQINQLVKDSVYNGINLLNGNDLTVLFNETRTSKTVISGQKVDAKGLGLTKASNQWLTKEDITAALEQIDLATSILKDFSTSLGNSYSFLENRISFSESMKEILSNGSTDLIAADIEEESANLLALETMQSLAMNTLSLSISSNKNILTLFN